MRPPGAGIIPSQAVLGTMKDPSITRCRELAGEAGAHVVRIPPVEPNILAR